MQCPSASIQRASSSPIRSAGSTSSSFSSGSEHSSWSPSSGSESDTSSMKTDKTISTSSSTCEQHTAPAMNDASTSKVIIPTFNRQEAFQSRSNTLGKTVTSSTTESFQIKRNANGRALSTRLPRKRHCPWLKTRAPGTTSFNTTRYCHSVNNTSPTRSHPMNHNSQSGMTCLPNLNSSKHK